MISESASERPLATFALFAYNQEKYIREAVEGALSQTYEPLEIILSDDCSTDRTFDIMQEMVTDYNGRHRINLRRNSKNMGLIKHLTAVAEIASSEYLIVAAGDDIAIPNRTSILMTVFKSGENVMAAFSDFNRIGRAPARDVTKSIPLKKSTLLDIAITGGGEGWGATYAYRKECFFWPNQLPHNLLCEDRILPLRAALLGDVYWAKTPLILYRTVDTSVYHTLRDQGTLAIDHADNWDAIMKTLHAAVHQKKISRVSGNLLILLTSLTRWMRRPERYGERVGSPLLATLGRFLFLPLRAIRKSQFRKKLRLDLP